MIQKTCGIPALRVVQIDAKILDNEIEKIIENQLDQIAVNLPIRWAILWQKLAEEIRLALSAVLWSYRYIKGISPGQEMMDVAYIRYTKRRVIAHFLLVVMLPYLLSKNLNMLTLLLLDFSTTLTLTENFFGTLIETFLSSFYRSIKNSVLHFVDIKQENLAPATPMKGSR
uniref:Pex N-terminal domain-containing protein n=1 Tax=Acrobeloides nanus TaxID=290746 RepID=A0A914CJM2_9BILA